MLNIDSDVEGEFLTSCAGGRSLNAQIPLTRATMEGSCLHLTVTGLLGGHSGSEIDKEHANAILIMGRALEQILAVTPCGVLELTGGGKDNAIPRVCECRMILPEDGVEAAKQAVAELTSVLQKEYAHSDPGITLRIREEGMREGDILDFASMNRLLLFLRLIPNGVAGRSTVIPGLVETSSNLGILSLKKEALYAVISIRSSISSRKEELSGRILRLIELAGGTWELEGDYPAWEYVSDSALRGLIDTVYEEQYGKKPVFSAIHAGLECGIFSDKLKGVDCVSFGPTNFDIHTPKERLSISSSQRVWQFLITLLERMK